MKPLNKKSQITIFIILALIVIVLIILIFLLKSPPKIRVLNEDEPQAYVESCTREYVEEAIRLISQHGGDIEPKGSISYENLDRTYLCYNNNYYEGCINQRPLLVEHIEKEITDYITPHLEKCFEELISSYGNRYNVELEEQMKVNTILQSKNVYVEIGRELDAKRGGESRNFKKFSMHLNSPIYNFAEIAMEIVNQETKYCNFDVISYMFLYPEYDITKFITGDSNIIYVITERATNQKFTFAVRGCVMPPSF